MKYGIKYSPEILDRICNAVLFSSRRNSSESRNLSFTSQLQNKLKNYIQSENPEQRLKLKRELEMEIPHPQFVTKCDFIPNEHPVKRDAWIISDAFEAVTNGMFSAELSGELNTIEKDSLFLPWVPLIQGIETFYSGSFSEVLPLLETIPDWSAPYAYIGFFKAVINKTAMPESWKELSESVLDDNMELASSMEQLTEAAQAGMEDILLETAGMIIKDILREHPETAQKILIWCFHQIQEEDILPDKAADKARLLFGDSEGLRLTALATLSYDQDKSLVYWLLTLQAYLEGNSTSRAEVKAYLRIIKDVSETVALEFELTDEYLSLIATHSVSLIAGLNHLYPDMVENINSKTQTEPDSVMKLLQSLAGEKEKAPASSHKKITQNSSAPVQLELFAF